MCWELITTGSGTASVGDAIWGNSGPAYLIGVRRATDEFRVIQVDEGVATLRACPPGPCHSSIDPPDQHLLHCHHGCMQHFQHRRCYFEDLTLHGPLTQSAEVCSPGATPSECGGTAAPAHLNAEPAIRRETALGPKHCLRDPRLPDLSCSLLDEPFPPLIFLWDPASGRSPLRGHRSKILLSTKK